MTSTILFVHGAWLTPNCWSSWRNRFEALGFQTLAPTWPFMDRPIDELRNNPDPRLAKLNIRDIVDHYAAVIDKLEKPPIIIGHSFGGLVTQMLIDRGLGEAGVAIDPAPPGGVIPGLRSVISALPVLTAWLGWNRVLKMSRADFKRDFANGLTESAQDFVFEQQVVPAPGRPYFQAALGIGNRVKFDEIFDPLLFVSGGKDRTSQPSMVRAIQRKYRKAGAPADLAVFPNGSHFLIGENGWEDIVDTIVTWMGQQGVGMAVRESTLAA